ncbi:phage tail protein [Methylobacterium sp. WSM2598]|uniref:phage tail protein n=1 Tax=Methylobacterium sp. WSM2598 TaxID=398261 RepID=UPI0003AAB831|nr:tail fiber protein [Methylobacterium sp. WSM2598]
MTAPYVGQITLFAGNFAPRNWAFCNGQIMQIAQHPALFAILGNTYGGDGKTTFALPDLRGRVPLHPGQGAGLSSYVLGQHAGTETVTLGVQQIPAHSHKITGDATDGNVSSPDKAHLAQATVTIGGRPTPVLNHTSGTAAKPVSLADDTVQNAGGSQAHPNIQPYLALNFIIAVEGIYPARN